MVNFEQVIAGWVCIKTCSVKVLCLYLGFENKHIFIWTPSFQEKVFTFSKVHPQSYGKLTSKSKKVFSWDASLLWIFFDQLFTKVPSKNLNHILGAFQASDLLE